MLCLPAASRVLWVGEAGNSGTNHLTLEPGHSQGAFLHLPPPPRTSSHPLDSGLSSISCPAHCGEDGGCGASPGEELLLGGPGEALPSSLFPLLPGDLRTGGSCGLLSH